MTSKEALKNICSKCEIAKGERQIACPFRSIDNEYCDDYDIIKQSLDRLEKLEKAIEILKRFHLNVNETNHNNTGYEIWTDSLLETQEITQEEYELLKEVLESE